MSVTDAPPNGGGKNFVGQSMKRREDSRLMTGRGDYIDDMVLPGMLHMSVVRSPEAHANITSIDVAEAKEMPGVVAVFTKDDLADLIKAPLPMAWDPPGVEIKVPENWPLSGSQVKHVGDAIAVVLAESKGQAMDAADLVIADLDPLPAVVDPEKALEDGSPLVWEEFGTNATHHWGVAGGDFAAAEAEAEVVVKQRVPNHRISGAPIEPRGCVGESRGESVALYSATQIPHIARFLLAGILEMPEDKIRVVAPDVGGGFGAKLQLYGEEVLVLALAKKLNRPVKYVETRSEHMSNSHHGRDQIANVTLTAKKDGTVTGCKAEVIADTGAYHQLLTPFIASLGFPVAGGCYKFAAIDFSVTGVFTNKMPIDAIRGAGRPEATYWIEQTMDKLARELDMDPLELRRKNFIGKDEFPYETPLGIVYDSGDYHGRAGQAAGELRPGRVPQGAGRAAGEGHPPRRRLLDLGRGVRPGAVTRRRPAGRRPPGRVLGVGHGARAPVRLGHRLLGLVAARPGPGHVVRADRGRPAGHRPRDDRRDPRRHGLRPVRLGHVRLALALGGRRGHRPRLREGAGEGQEGLRRAAGGRARGHRAGRRRPSA